MHDAAADISTYVVGVTGGIGSGKSTISNAFHDRFGVPVIDADDIARDVVQPGRPALDELVNAFGKDILDDEGCLDRRRLKRIVFADESRRKELEGILHPRIRQQMQQHLSHVSEPYCLLGIPLLAEGGRNELINRILVVDCPPELQISRVTNRDNLTAEEVMAIMKAQASSATRLAIADDVIVNDGDESALSVKIERLHQIYSVLAEEKLAAAGGR